MEALAQNPFALTIVVESRARNNAMNTIFENCVSAAMENLETAQAELVREIKSYPTPIAGCDAQFNHLLEERARVNAALDALKAQVFTPTPRQLAPS